MLELYQFKEIRKYWKGSAPTVCIGPLSEICALIDRDELKMLFGGYVVYEGEGQAEFIGVWGGRNAARLRRTLRERGSTLHLLNSLPRESRVKVRAVFDSSRSAQLA
ncbi:hypothetical protein ABH994_006626 [Bradyrhizobium yuanmingense]|uniref:hypothetical protein n=1 Tax=Bradyrhizobium yuanmingense TaxID=108015 RepID=UPI003511DF80